MILSKLNHWHVLCFCKPQGLLNQHSLHNSIRCKNTATVAKRHGNQAISKQPVSYVYERQDTNNGSLTNGISTCIACFVAVRRTCIRVCKQPPRNQIIHVVRAASHDRISPSSDLIGTAILVTVRKAFPVRTIALPHR